MKIALFVTSASRPKVLEKTLVDLEKRVVDCNPGTEFVKVLHEDCLDPEKLHETKYLAQHFGYERIVSNPSVGLCRSIYKGLQHIYLPYILRFEDDWEIIRNIPVDEVIVWMERYKKINQVIFNKRKTERKKAVDGQWFILKEIRLENFQGRITMSPFWGLLPAIWRTSFVKPKFVEPPLQAKTREFIDNIVFGPEMDRSHKNIAENVGCYFYGKIMEKPFIKHTGTGILSSLMRLGRPA